MSIDEIIKLILGSGGVLACLVFAVRWLGGDLQRKELRLETEREKRFEELIAAHSKLEEEREKRISALAESQRLLIQERDHRISLLEEANKRCMSEHSEARSEMRKINETLLNLMKGIAVKTTAANPGACDGGCVKGALHP